VYVVDASVWVSRFIARDTFHSSSRLWLGSVLAAQTIVAAPALLLPEVGGALARQTGRSDLALRALALLRQFPGVRFANIEAELGRSASDVAAELRLRGADAVYVALADKLNVPLVTWDREQRERGAARVETVTPAELLTASR
jgi:predicted nucleic acid-binding protein